MTIQGTFVDGTTNTVEERDLTDAEILADFFPQVALTADKQTVTADGTDFVTIRVQLHSVPLSDGKPRNLAIVHKVVLQVAEAEHMLETDANGRAELEIDVDDEGEYPVRALNLHSNVLTITAV